MISSAQERPDCFIIKHTEKSRPTVISKKGLSKEALAKMRGMCTGGKVRGYDDGGAVTADNFVLGPQPIVSSNGANDSQELVTTPVTRPNPDQSINGTNFVLGPQPIVSSTGANDPQEIDQPAFNQMGQPATAPETTPAVNPTIASDALNPDTSLHTAIEQLRPSDPTSTVMDQSTPPKQISGDTTVSPQVQRTYELMNEKTGRTIAQHPDATLDQINDIRTISGLPAIDKKTFNKWHADAISSDTGLNPSQIQQLSTTGVLPPGTARQFTAADPDTTDANPNKPITVPTQPPVNPDLATYLKKNPKDTYTETTGQIPVDDNGQVTDAYVKAQVKASTNADGDGPGFDQTKKELQRMYDNETHRADAEKVLDSVLNKTQAPVVEQTVPSTVINTTPTSSTPTITFTKAPQNQRNATQVVPVTPITKAETSNTYTAPSKVTGLGNTALVNPTIPTPLTPDQEAEADVRGSVAAPTAPQSLGDKLKAILSKPDFSSISKSGLSAVSNISKADQQPTPKASYGSQDAQSEAQARQAQSAERQAIAELARTGQNRIQDTGAESAQNTRDAAAFLNSLIQSKAGNTSALSGVKDVRSRIAALEALLKGK